MRTNVDCLPSHGSWLPRHRLPAAPLGCGVGGKAVACVGGVEATEHVVGGASGGSDSS
jgi:hypothetical protein